MEQNEIFDEGFDELYEVDGIEGDIDGADNDGADSDDSQLYEHRKVIVDPGQAPVRVDNTLPTVCLIPAVIEYRMLPIQASSLLMVRL